MTTSLQPKIISPINKQKTVGKSNHFFQPKLSINQPNDIYEHEADAIADNVMRMKEPSSEKKFFSPPVVQRKCAQCGEKEKKMHRKENSNETAEASPQTENYISGLSGGRSLSKEERSFFEPRMGYDFSNVRLHTNAEANESAKNVNALAYTHGDNIVFGSNQYQPGTEGGKKLLAHELTHTIQQKQITAQHPQKMLQRTEVGSILDEFFSPFSTQTLWNMNESDGYTRRVRAWLPVIGAMNSIKQRIANDCAGWSATHRTTPGWAPGLNAIPDPNAYHTLIPSPPGTDPATCAEAFTVFQTTRAAPLLPTIQTDSLYTCSIGSFTLAVTVNSIDCVNRTADINVWMYNVMSQRSFGMFSRLFPISGQQNQFMWWNWDETIRWTNSGGVTTDPERRTGWW
jgi:hypothetical protein